MANQNRLTHRPVVDNGKPREPVAQQHHGMNSTGRSMLACRYRKYISAQRIVDWLDLNEFATGCEGE
ncbi:hypothetical protein H8Z60_29975 [Mycolicibacterium fortuitum]|uniref:hypothetical protein n=1 Tax=Mycolicibacterium fortuitum TaxID=1766 RepID=UPI001042326F|nr:hypothetical protein [Mycolicibacterium fortuitum]MCA4756735.1 hypothetical protein [Mycolicibacterium fortuitum]